MYKLRSVSHLKSLILSTHSLEEGSWSRICKNPASHFLFLSISHIPFPISANPASQEKPNLESRTVFSEVPDSKNTFPDPDFNGV